MFMVVPGRKLMLTIQILSGSIVIAFWVAPLAPFIAIQSPNSTTYSQ